MSIIIGAHFARSEWGSVCHALLYTRTMASGRTSLAQGFAAIMMFCITAAMFSGLTTGPAAAQWLHYPAPGTPRLPDGQPNLKALAPRAANGTPDLSGIWSEMCSYTYYSCFT